MKTNKQTIWITAIMLISAIIALNYPHHVLAQRGTSPSWQIVALDNAQGTLIGGRADDINASHEVVGFVVNPVGQGTLAAYWQTSGTSSQIRLLDGGSHAYGINDIGEIVGIGRDSNGDWRGFYWSNYNAASIVLPPLPGGLQSLAYRINNQSVICGYSVHPAVDSNGDPTTVRMAVVWRVVSFAGNPVVVGPIALPTAAEQCEAYAIGNGDGNGIASVVGVYRTWQLQRLAAVRWTVQADANGSLFVDTNVVVLENGDAEAFGVSDNGTACGESRSSITNPNKAKVWANGNTLTLNMGRTSATSARDMNTAGYIVGYGGTGIVDHNAFVWPSASSAPIVLNNFLPKKNPPFTFLKEALAINETGAIVGQAWDGNNYGAFLALRK